MTFDKEVLAYITSLVNIGSAWNGSLPYSFSFSNAASRSSLESQRSYIEGIHSEFIPEGIMDMSSRSALNLSMSFVTSFNFALRNHQYSNSRSCLISIHLQEPCGLIVVDCDIFVEGDAERNSN
jgi:hypothetical protein